MIQFLTAHPVIFVSLLALTGLGLMALAALIGDQHD